MGLSILLLCTATAFGGAETHALHLYQKLLENNYKTTICVAKGSPLESQLKEKRMPHHSLEPLKKRFLGVSVAPDISELLKICKDKAVSVIHCNEEREVEVAQRIIQKHPAKIVFTRHVASKLKKNSFKDVDAIVGVSSPIVSYVKKRKKAYEENRQLECKTKISRIPPFFSPQTFTTFQTNESRADFFKKHFGLKISDAPLLCMIANLYPTKNHALLLKSMREIIYKKHRDVQLVLAGKGPLQIKLEKMVKQLKLQDHVHFLGFTKKIPAILFHSDVNILPSKNEGLGIALLEAGLMKTPSIAASGSGMTDVVKDGKTGLLFENNDLNDLVKKLTRS